MANETLAKSGIGNTLFSKIILMILYDFLCKKSSFCSFFPCDNTSWRVLSAWLENWIFTILHMWEQLQVFKVGSELFPGRQHCFVVRCTGSRTNSKLFTLHMWNKDKSGICPFFRVIVRIKYFEIYRALRVMVHSKCCLSIRLVSNSVPLSFCQLLKTRVLHPMLVLFSHCTLQRPLGFCIVLG